MAPSPSRWRGGGGVEHLAVLRIFFFFFFFFGGGGGGVSEAEKASEKPAKGGFRNVGSPEIGGSAFKGRERAYAYLNNTEWGGGGGGGEPGIYCT